MKNKLTFVILLFISGSLFSTAIVVVTSIIDAITGSNITGEIISAFWLENPLYRIALFSIIVLLVGLIGFLMNKKMFKDMIKYSNQD